MMKFVKTLLAVGTTAYFTPTAIRWFTDEKTNKIKELPIWFIQSKITG